jgi:hypothetical protein
MGPSRLPPRHRNRCPVDSPGAGVPSGDSGSRVSPRRGCRSRRDRPTRWQSPQSPKPPVSVQGLASPEDAHGLPVGASRSPLVFSPRRGQNKSAQRQRPGCRDKEVPVALKGRNKEITEAFATMLISDVNPNFAAPESRPADQGFDHRTPSVDWGPARGSRTPFRGIPSGITAGPS